MRSRITRKLFLPFIAVAGLAFVTDHTRAAEISGVKLPDQVTVQGKTLKLNGAGLRQATFLKINAYAAGLYLENAMHDGDAIANSDQAKSIEMVFMRDVSAKQMADAFQEGFDKNCVAGCAELKPNIGKLQGLLKDMKKGETMAYHFLADGVDVMIRGQKVGKVGDKAFSHQLIRVWIGKNPPNSELKDGLVGGKK
ncbi:MAG: chalcone isomerase family protein [Chthoniobacterales bacterium]